MKHMASNRLAHRYAKSIIDLAIERNELEIINTDFRILNQAINNARDLELFLHSPIIHTDKKQAVLKLIFTDKINPMIMEFIQIITRKKREIYLLDITEAFIRQYNVIKRIEQVRLMTASPVNPGLVNQISNDLKKALRIEKVELEHSIEPELIGGFKLLFEDKQIDASLKHQLELLEKEFEA